MTTKPAELVLLSFYVLFLIIALSFAFLACWRINTYSFPSCLARNYAVSFTDLPETEYTNYGNPSTNTYLSFIARSRIRFQKKTAQEQLESAIERSMTINAETFSDRTQSTLSSDPISSGNSMKSPEISIIYSTWPASGPQKTTSQSYKEENGHRSNSFAMSHLSNGTDSSFHSGKSFASTGMDFSSLRPRDWSEAHVKKT
ncbi:hypothetical protein PGT21_001273 [Puccinia graminis f. sp. tritici]|uniref:Uncharacterized protein n=2 Tax=Puccinia graminis f. sp. tritici TaxID=56615 RepID=E3JVG3_PUCGT|nr:uncharacterized protein PGTG_01369 [Puccinia graminis f. sp. tritici CRL 75-36-700-3]EFP76038.2 hypothetical protein PGTG_01369 [Puccinia graminis f. sp. tritici CRL 75-36-700-3]KAA1070056.1 hypothetical protein PGTUg99_006769 [Puccinia graminis f. sp. tritici]KAA1071256.1 hypothetical protein PGT21_001374 [Puccinia graminis f. sp. tritici]KAA1077265.1 hypothetical protein PGT21_001273 [Puccinia graminis f. sp. tritici]